jgi:PAS domain S-box-containing protein
VTSHRRLVAGYGAASLVCAALAMALVFASDHETRPTLQTIIGEVIGLSFTTAGLLGALRRPANRTGRLVATVGFLFFAGALSEANGAFLATVGSALSQLFLAAFMHLLLAYPTGTLTRGARRLVIAAYGTAFVFPLAYTLAGRVQPGCDRCPHSALTVWDDAGARSALEAAATVCATGVLLLVIATLVRRWRSATPAYRSSFRLVLLSGGLAVGLLTIDLALGPLLGTPGDVAFQVLGGGAFVFVPFAFVGGLLGGRFAGAAVGRLVSGLGADPAPGSLRASLRDALGDPTLELGYWLPDLPGYVDIEGRPFDPAEGAASTPVDGETGRIGILVHDPALLERRELLDGVVAAARLALENERLHAELRARLTELERERDFTRLVVDTAPAYFCVVDPDGRIVRFNQALEHASGLPDDDATRGREFWDVFGTPDEVDAIRGSIGLTAATGRTSRHENTFLSADGTRHTVSWIDVMIPDERGQMRYVLVSGLDVTERKWHEDVQTALRHVATLVASGMGERELTAAVISEVDRLFEGHAANLLRMEAGTAVVSGVWARDGSPTFRVGEEFPIAGDSATTRAIRSGRAVRVDTFDELQEEPARELWRTHGTQTAVAAPIVVERSLWGAISVQRSTPEPFPAEAEERLADFAALVAQAIANAGAQAEIRASRARLVAAADAERKKLERNLHDGAQQRLVSISIALRLAQAKLAAAPQEAAALIESASDELAHALDELREFARGIHPAVLTDRGLAPAVGALAERAPVPGTVECDL